MLTNAERLPFVPPPPHTKKKVDPFFFLTHFPSSIYFIYFISYNITVSINGLDHNKHQHRQTFFNKPLPGIELGSRRLPSAALPRPTKSTPRKTSWKQSVSRSHIDNIKNSAISVVAGAIYMRSLASSRFNSRFFPWAVKHYGQENISRWLTRE